MNATDIRDGVEWKPWWVRYAEFDGGSIAIWDRDAWQPCHPDAWEPPKTRYSVVTRTEPRSCRICGRHDQWAGLAIETDDLDEAIAAFHEAERRLIAGELDG